MKGPIANLEDSIAKMRAKTYAALPQLSRILAEFGDPRKWTDDGVQPIKWDTGMNLMRCVAAYDEWLTGAWNHVPGVIGPDD